MKSNFPSPPLFFFLSWGNLNTFSFLSLLLFSSLSLPGWGSSWKTWRSSMTFVKSITTRSLNQRIWSSSCLRPSWFNRRRFVSKKPRKYGSKHTSIILSDLWVRFHLMTLLSSFFSFLARQSAAFKQQMDAVTQREEDLRRQLDTYADKFNQVQEAINKSNQVFGTFKQEMEQVGNFWLFFFSFNQVSLTTLPFIFSLQLTRWPKSWGN